MDFSFNTQRMHSFSSISTPHSKLVLFIPRHLTLLFYFLQKKKNLIFARWICTAACAFLLKLLRLYKEFHFKCDKGVKTRKAGERKGICSVPESLFNRN